MTTIWLVYCHHCGRTYDKDYSWMLTYPHKVEGVIQDGKAGFCSPACLIEHIFDSENEKKKDLTAKDGMYVVEGLL